MTQSPLMLYLKVHNCHIPSDGVGMADGFGVFEVEDMGGWGYGSGYGEGGFGSRGSGDWVDPDFYRERQRRGVLGIAMNPLKVFALAFGVSEETIALQGEGTMASGDYDGDLDGAGDGDGRGNGWGDGHFTGAGNTSGTFDDNAYTPHNHV